MLYIAIGTFKVAPGSANSTRGSSVQDHGHTFNPAVLILTDQNVRCLSRSLLKIKFEKQSIREMLFICS